MARGKNIGLFIKLVDTQIPTPWVAGKTWWLDCTSMSLKVWDGTQWLAITAVGSVGGGGTALTVRESDGVPTVTSVATITFSQAEGLTVTDAGGGSATIHLVPAGSDSWVQYNNGGVFGGDVTFTLNDSTKFVTMQGLNLTKEVLSPVTELAMSGTLTLVAGTSNTNQFLDPNGSNRQVNLPAAVTGLTYFIQHVGSANTLTIKDNGGSTLATISTPLSFYTFIYSGSAWRVI